MLWFYFFFVLLFYFRQCIVIMLMQWTSKCDRRYSNVFFNLYIYLQFNSFTDSIIIFYMHLFLMMYRNMSVYVVQNKLSYKTAWMQFTFTYILSTLLVQIVNRNHLSRGGHYSQSGSNWLLWFVLFLLTLSPFILWSIIYNSLN